MLSVMDLYAAEGLEARRASSRELHGPCPGCGGRDRFCIYPQQNDGLGSYHCGHGKGGNGCGKGGDNVQYLVDFHGLSFREAAERVGKELQKPTASTKLSLPPRKKALATGPVIRKDIVTRTWMSEVRVPQKWQDAADKFAEKCHLALLGNDRALAWLAARGVNSAMVAKYQLGLNTGTTRNGATRQPLYRPWVSWGLPDEKRGNGRPRVLALPAGIVIPWADDAGRTVRIRIRASNPRPQDPKYHVVKGSRLDTWISSHGRTVYVIVETELDAAMIDGLAGDICGQVALGAVAIPPDKAADRSLRNAALIINCLDNDEAGNKESAWWQSRYPQCIRLTPPDGSKDPGDAYSNGVDIRQWLYDAMPKGLQYRYKNRLRGSISDSGRMVSEGGEGGSEQAETEIAKFLREMARQRGVLLVSDRGRTMGLRYQMPTTPESRIARNELAMMLYSGEEVPLYVRLLDDGIWNVRRLAEFCDV